MPFINTPKDEKYQYVDDILSASDYYRVLGVKTNATIDQIRKAYITKSRICHPDKFVPSYPRATESFQTYETLSDPSTKLLYDLSKQKGKLGSFVPPEYNDQPNDTLHRVLQQLFNEMMEGEFQTMRAFIYALNETNPAMHITEEAIHQIELCFQKLSELFKSSHQYYKVVQFELMKLYELQHELRQLSYFSLWKRMQLSIRICKILLQIPIIISIESRQRQLLKNSDFKDKSTGFLNQKLENALQMAVDILEAGENYTKVW